MPSASQTTLTFQVRQLADRFADHLLKAFAAQRLEDVLVAFRRGSAEPAPTSRRTRAPLSTTSQAALSRSSADSQTDDRGAVLGRLVATIAQAKDGVRAEELRKQTGLSKGAFARAVRDGLATGEVRKEGSLRSTRYFAAA